MGWGNATGYKSKDPYALTLCLRGVQDSALLIHLQSECLGWFRTIGGNMDTLRQCLLARNRSGRNRSHWHCGCSAKRMLESARQGKGPPKF
jgi:hypothetical protein